MLIPFFGCFTVWMWAMLPVFRKYILPPPSGSKCEAGLSVYLSRVLVTTEGIPIGNWIYWHLIQSTRTVTKSSNHIQSLHRPTSNSHSYCCHTRLSGHVYTACCIAANTAWSLSDHCFCCCVFVGTCLLSRCLAKGSIRHNTIVFQKNSATEKLRNWCHLGRQGQWTRKAPSLFGALHGPYKGRLHNFPGSVSLLPTTGGTNPDSPSPSSSFFETRFYTNAKTQTLHTSTMEMEAI
jgi:hypothetical protein